MNKKSETASEYIESVSDWLRSYDLDVDKGALADAAIVALTKACREKGVRIIPDVYKYEAFNVACCLLGVWTPMEISKVYGKWDSEMLDPQ